VGGQGKEFWAFGKIPPNAPPPDAGNEIVVWRAELSPPGPAPVEVKRIQAEGVTVLFRTDGNKTTRLVRFRSQGDRFLITDLAEGTWQVWRDGMVVRPAVQVLAERGVLWFEGPPGDYELRR